ncbi:MAG TPA: dipeptidase, partial [Candidatus Enterocloster faecavium]|nr:dipeptidase [Candidatus Enterocloster faecavium]
MELFDLHCDTLVKYQEEGKDFLSGGTMFSLRNRRLLKRMCQTMAIFVPDSVRGQEAEAYFDRNCAYFKTLLKKQGDLAAQARSGEEIERITGEGKCAL